MCMQGDAATNAKGVGSIGDGWSENREAQVGSFWGLLACFCPCCAEWARLKTPALLPDGI